MIKMIIDTKKKFNTSKCDNCGNIIRNEDDTIYACKICKNKCWIKITLVEVIKEK